MSGRKNAIIAIDGPAASGKSTVALAVSRRLGISLLDSGAMYRAVTLLAIQRGVDSDDGAALGELAREVRDELRFETGPGGRTVVMLSGRDVTDALRSPEVGDAVSPVSVAPEVRAEMVALQRKLVAGTDAVVEGRDIGTTVFPDAPLKVFLDAGFDERVRRRYEEMRDKGAETAREQVAAEIEKRDRIDSSRRDSPLAVADDAYRLDTTGKTVEQVALEIIRVARDRGMIGEY